MTFVLAGFFLFVCWASPRLISLAAAVVFRCCKAIARMVFRAALLLCLVVCKRSPRVMEKSRLLDVARTEEISPIQRPRKNHTHPTICYLSMPWMYLIYSERGCISMSNVSVRPWESWEMPCCSSLAPHFPPISATRRLLMSAWSSLAVTGRWLSLRLWLF